MNAMKVCILLISLFSASAYAVIDGHKYPFEDPADAARFEQLAEDLRCPKCQNQNLADSNAPVAADLRDKVYELMQEGKNDQEVVDYLVARYGDFVRYKPPFRLDTLLLWGSPVLMLIFGIILVIGLRRQAGASPSVLTAEEQQKLNELKARLNDSETTADTTAENRNS
ncbi:MAG: cytochrome c-type biogenesis protein [Thalassolituus sp.]